MVLVLDISSLCFCFYTNLKVLFFPNWSENGAIFPNLTGMGTVPKSVKKITCTDVIT